MLWGLVIAVAWGSRPYPGRSLSAHVLRAGFAVLVVSASALRGAMIPPVELYLKPLLAR